MDYKWIDYIGFAFLTYNSTVAIYRSIHDGPGIAFITAIYVDLLSVFWCLRKFETTAEENRGWLRAAVWVMTTLIIVMFSDKLAATTPLQVSLAVYGMAAVTAVGFLSFLY